MTFIDAVRVRLLALSVGLLIMVLASAVQGELVVQSWVSSSDMSQRLAAQEPLRFGPGPCSTATVIRVDPGRTFQTILGLGSSLEHSTCYNIARLPKERQAKVMESLVDAEAGIGMSLMRICIGTPDFTASSWYSYDDVPVGQTDPALNAFSIEKDRQYVLPILKLALEKNPELLIF